MSDGVSGRRGDNKKANREAPKRRRPNRFGPGQAVIWVAERLFERTALAGR
jgi:hypothetical protein